VPGPIEVRPLESIPERRFPRFWEHVGLGWRGSDVRRFLLDFKTSLTIPEIRNNPLELFKKLTATFFSASTPENQLRIAEDMLQGFKKATGLENLGETLTESFIDKILQKIDPQRRYTFEETILKFVEEAAIGEVQNGLFPGEVQCGCDQQPREPGVQPTF